MQASVNGSIVSLHCLACMSVEVSELTEKTHSEILDRGLVGKFLRCCRSQAAVECSQKGAAVYRAAARLLRTEFARVQVSEELNSLKEIGFKM